MLGWTRSAPWLRRVTAIVTPAPVQSNPGLLCGEGISRVTDRYGIDALYRDADGRLRRVPRAARERLAEIIGEPQSGAPAVAVVGPDDARSLRAGRVLLEDGGAIAVPGDEKLPLGYHELERADGSRSTLIVAPQRCHLPTDWRAWGVAAQLYASRSRRSWGIGDFDDLGRLGRFAATTGADFVLVNPLGAVAPTLPQQPSPYFPASRRFLNPLYLSVERAPGAGAARDAVATARRACRTLNAQRLIDRDAVWRHKRAALEAIFVASSPPAAFEEWRAGKGAALETFEAWCVLCERHGPRWRSWPARDARPDRSVVARVRREHAGRARFHAWLQWLATDQLARAGRDVALFHDLPVGVDPDGFDAWCFQDELALDAAIGAPPDAFNARGQDWGLPPFVPWKLTAARYAPFIETIRAAFSSGRGLRIDHVMGLFRLWWIPRGEDPAHGAYVRYPASDLLGIVALESQRAGAVVVGEDLGTVEEAVRDELRARDLLSYRLLWFEDDPPRRWPKTAMAAVTTHDLPTVAGLWTGRDVARQRKLGLEPNVEGTAAIRRRLARRAGLRAGAPVDDAVRGAYRLLAESPATLLTATLEDMVGEERRPNVPGADDLRPNWSLALEEPLEEVTVSPLARDVARSLDAAVHPPSPDIPARGGAGI